MEVTRLLLRRNPKQWQIVTASRLYSRNTNCITPIIQHNQSLINTKFMGYNNTSILVLKRYQNTKNTTEKTKEDGPPAAATTLAAKLKEAVKQYGSTVIVFHVAISLVSLGTFYLLVSNGLDVRKFIASLGITGETSEKIAENAGTFAIAYAVHKVFAPVRIMITLTSTPFIVRYLRTIGVIKTKIVKK